jgi:CxxC motif-containing protein (DUF1111 family)
VARRARRRRDERAARDAFRARDAEGLRRHAVRRRLPDAGLVARRRTTPLFGLGLLEALPDAELPRLAALEAARTPAIAALPAGEHAALLAFLGSL